MSANEASTLPVIGLERQILTQTLSLNTYPHFAGE